MRFIYKLILTLLLIINLGKQTSGQSALPAQISKGIIKWTQENPQEKIVLQTDKDYFVASEKIWFKIWTHIDQQPSFLSRIAYVDLIDDSGNVRMKQMYELDSLGTAAGHFNLPADIKSGNFTVRSYTLWMLNYPSFAATVPIFVFNTDYKPNQQKSKPSVYMQFFPEGGQMVNGLTSKTAFKTVTEKGIPISVKGSVFDNTGMKVTSFITAHDGMGIFEITPSAGKTYHAILDGVSEKFKLPASESEGITMSIDNSRSARLIVSVERSELRKAYYNQLYIVAAINGKLVFFNQFNFDEGLSAAAIPKKNLPAGILHVTIFHPSGLILAERLAFIENQIINQPLITQTNHQEYKGISYVSFRIDSLTTTANLLICSDASMVKPVHTSNNIASSILLTGDLTGYIHNPGYYFENKTVERLQHLDLLLMTHGWKRYSWKDILSNNAVPLQFPVETSIRLGGKVTKSDRQEIIKDGKVSFIIKAEDSTTMLSDAALTDKGEFLIENLRLYKRADVYYQGTNSRKEKFIVDVAFYPTYIDTLKRTSMTNRINLDTFNSANNNTTWKYVMASLTRIDSIENNSKQLKEIIIQGKRRPARKDSLNMAYASPGVFQSGQSLDPSDNQSNQNIWYYLQTQIAGLRVEGRFNPNVYFTRYSDLQIPGGEEPVTDAFGNKEMNGVLLNRGGIAFYLNEINVPQEVIETLVLNDIALIKVLRTEAAALGISSGAIAIYTKKGAAVANALYEKNFSKMSVTGYTVNSSFYALPAMSETYITPQPTLLWNAGIMPKDNTIVLSFDARIKPATIRFLLQGIDEEGNINLVEKTIEVSYK